MHSRNLARRNDEARASLLASASAIAAALGIPEGEANIGGEWDRDPAVRSLYEIESLAAFLAGAARRMGHGPADGEGAERPEGGGEAPAGTPLPDDFPAADLLRAEGHDTREKVSALTASDLIAMRGIGRATAERIVRAASEEHG